MLDSLYPQCRNREDGDDGKESGDVAAELCRGLCVGAHDYRKAKLTCVKFYVPTHTQTQKGIDGNRPAIIFMKISDKLSLLMQRRCSRRGQKNA